MAKFFVCIVINKRRHRICKDDIRNFSSLKPRNLPKVPAYLSPNEKNQEEDRLTSCEEGEAQFEPVQFFPPTLIQEK